MHERKDARTHAAFFSAGRCRSRWYADHSLSTKVTAPIPLLVRASVRPAAGATFLHSCMNECKTLPCRRIGRERDPSPEPTVGVRLALHPCLLSEVPSCIHACTLATLLACMLPTMLESMHAGIAACRLAFKLARSPDLLLCTLSGLGPRLNLPHDLSCMNGRIPSDTARVTFAIGG